jgi:hypothetical protein
MAAADKTKKPTITPVEWQAKLEGCTLDISVINTLILQHLRAEGFKEAADRFVEELGEASSSAGPADATLEDRSRVRNMLDKCISVLTTFLAPPPLAA